MIAEFSRPVRIDTLTPAPRAMAIEADADERAALARRFGLQEIGVLKAELSLVRNGEAVTATGELSAEVVQSCVATGEPVPARVEEPFALLFRPQPETNPDEEVELSEGELDVIFYAGALIDVGEAVAETLSLALDPYPRSPTADALLEQAGVLSEEEARAKTGPFSGLAALKDKLK